MSDRAPYSRVYWTVLDDTKFDAIRADMRLFGSWTMMLVVADMAYPAPAFIPPHVSRASSAALVDAGLIELLPARMFRVRGLRAERERRAAAATRGPNRTPPAPQPGPNGTPDGTLDETRTRKDETSQRARAQEAARALDEASRRRYERMVARRLEWYRRTGEWDPDWGEKPDAESETA